MNVLLRTTVLSALLIEYCHQRVYVIMVILNLNKIFAKVILCINIKNVIISAPLVIVNHLHVFRVNCLDKILLYASVILITTKTNIHRFVRVINIL